MNRRLVAAAAVIAMLAQGFGMAWAAPHLSPPANDDAAAMAEMPCHGAAADAADTTTPCDCCNGGCIFACGGAPLQTLAFATTALTPDRVFPAAAILAPLASHSLKPFRPPAA
jgi:hypothetical protein